MTLKSVLFSLATLLVLASVIVACDDHRLFPNDAKIRLVATLSGSAERPTPVVSAATGSFVGMLDRATRVLSYTVTYSGLTPVAGHLHRINAANGNGPVEIPFASLGSPIIGTTTLTTDTRVDSLINGFYYANLHTAAYPGGEIRGNVRVDGPIRLDATLSGAQEKPTPNASTATGTFVGVVDPATRVLSYTVTYSGLAPTAGHLHRVTAANGTGGVEIPFASLASPIIGTATLTTATRVDSLLNGFYYANLHTPAFPAGEIRGDIK
ncbi:CHRD domain-containing protein [Fibrivirga algicola]|uniref:CHRD domain-containing protein n=1 Tax=Fibrivirga algicola TaxID=2950420 RepID=A0ABX0QGK4_9BACT|nr:CHRD domain-containing protein [Fibrivirga algicola]NID11018.1 CHRD domain-containing protein [Fibrivirga algicola]